MQPRNAELVKDFQAAMGMERGLTLPANADSETFELWRGLVAEEMEEVELALIDLERPTRKPGDTAALVKEMADLMYVLYGLANVFQIDLDEAFRRVHASNMSKLDENGKPVFRGDGKVLKGPNYRPPNLAGLY